MCESPGLEAGKKNPFLGAVNWPSPTDQICTSRFTRRNHRRERDHGVGGHRDGWLGTGVWNVERGYGSELESGELRKGVACFHRHTGNLQAICAYPFYAWLARSDWIVALQQVWRQDNTERDVMIIYSQPWCIDITTVNTCRHCSEDLVVG